jgi:hypothetical protein
VQGYTAQLVPNLSTTAEGNRVVEYRANAKLSFVVDEAR